MSRSIVLTLGVLALVACGGESRSRASGEAADGGTGGSESGAGATVGSGGDSQAAMGTGGTGGGSGPVTAGTTASGGSGGSSGSGAATGGTAAGGGDGGTSGSGTGGFGGSSGDEGGTPGTGGVEVIDDVDHGGDQPQVPGSAFFWAGGLGNWFVYAPAPNLLSGDAQAADIVPPRGESTRAYRLQGKDHELGADLWAQLEHPLGRALDLSEYAGIAFWARLESDSGRLVVALSRGGKQYLDAPSGVPYIELSVSSDWEQFVLPFSAFPSDGTGIASFDFVTGYGGEAFDLWIDDLAFLCKEACPASD